ncbi:MAG: OmpH family outer membrane protein [Rhodothermales bacterium]
MLQRIFRITALGLLLFSALSADALAQIAALKIGYTDHASLIAAMPAFQQAQQTLQAEARQDEEGLRAMFDEYQEKLDRYQKQQALLTAERRTQREQELLLLQQDIQNAEQMSQQKLGERQAALYAPIFDLVDEALQAVAKEKGLDIVLRSRIGPTEPLILYVNEDKIVDITLDVARKLGLDVSGDEQTSSN